MDRKKLLDSAVAAIGELVPRASKTAFIRAAFDEISTSISSGVPISAIVESLNENGLSINLAHFKSIMTGIRKERGQGRSAKKTETAGPENNLARPVGRGAGVAKQPVKPISLDGDRSSLLESLGLDPDDGIRENENIVSGGFFSNVNKGK